MRLKLQGFSFHVIYRSGKMNPTDYASRQPQPFVNSTKEEKKISEELEAHVNWIVSGIVPPSLTLKKIQQATACDLVFKKLINGLETDTIDCVNESDLRQFKHVIGELSVKDGVVIRGSRIVIPSKLQKSVVEIAHEGYQGLVEAKQLLRSHIWFPGLDAKAASVINTCAACQAVVSVYAQEPITSTELPNGPCES